MRDDPETLTPTEGQAEVRVIEREHAGERPPGTDSFATSASRGVATPLFRLARSLPGSGKSRLVVLQKRCFESVWQRARNKQRALVAPANAMADMVSCSAMRTFGRVPFKGSRGALIHSSGETMSVGGSVAPATDAICGSY